MYNLDNKKAVHDVVDGSPAESPSKRESVNHSNVNEITNENIDNVSFKLLLSHHLFILYTYTKYTKRTYVSIYI